MNYTCSKLANGAENYIYYDTETEREREQKKMQGLWKVVI